MKNKLNNNIGVPTSNNNVNNNNNNDKILKMDDFDDLASDYSFFTLDKTDKIKIFKEELLLKIKKDNFGDIDYDILKLTFTKFLDIYKICDDITLLPGFIKTIKSCRSDNTFDMESRIDYILISSILDVFLRDNILGSQYKDILKYFSSEKSENDEYLRMIYSSNYYEAFKSDDIIRVWNFVSEGFDYGKELINNGDITMAEFSEIVRFQDGFWKGITKNISEYFSNNGDSKKYLDSLGIKDKISNLSSGDSVSKGKILQALISKNNSSTKLRSKLANFDIFKKYNEMIDIKSGGLGDLKSLKGKKVCITGALSYLRADIENKITSCGGINVGTITKYTDILVVADMNTSSSKKVKADELIKKGSKIKIITEKQLIDLINNKT